MIETFTVSVVLLRSFLKVAALTSFSLAPNFLQSASPGDSLITMEPRVVNGETVNAGDYPFLTAVHSGRVVSVQINDSALSAEFVGGSLQSEFAGELIDCGVASSVCEGAAGKVCTIVIDVPPSPNVVTTIATQILNCSTGGGVGVIFRSSAPVSRFPDLREYSEIPTVFLRSGAPYEALVSALQIGEVAYVSVTRELSHRIVCGATYIGDVWVLTAAHCVVDVDAAGNYRVRNPEELMVNVGVHDLLAERQSALPLADVIVGDYRLSGPWSENDFALLKLQSPLQNGTTIPLIDKDSLDALMASAAPALVLGWGSQMAREPLTEALASVTTLTPRAARLNLHTVSGCRSLWRSFFQENNLSMRGLDIRDIHLCASHPEKLQDACQGDSGGPLLVESDGVLKLAGITSFGLGCGAADSVPGVYASVPSFKDWVSLNTGLFDRDSLATVQVDDSFNIVQHSGAVDFVLLLIAVFYLLYTVASKRCN